MIGSTCDKSKQAENMGVDYYNKDKQNKADIDRRLKDKQYDVEDLDDDDRHDEGEYVDGNDIASNVSQPSDAKPHHLDTLVK